MGGALWHSFDHQRGYHPEPFYGGIMDNFRQPKYSYYMFQSQRPASAGPMVYIAHAMTPFSDRDVTVYSNCDEVRLTFCSDGAPMTYVKDRGRAGMPSPVIVFKDAYDFMTDKRKTMGGHGEEVYLLAEGIIGGEVVATHKVCPCRRPVKVILWTDDEGMALRADGSDCVVVVAAVADADGNVRRLSNEYIRFEVEGEGRISGDASINANPVPVRWGTAPVILQSTVNPGTVRIRASVLYAGSEKPCAGELELTVLPAEHPLIFDADEAALIPMSGNSAQSCFPADTSLRRSLAVPDEVAKQQKKYGE